MPTIAINKQNIKDVRGILGSLEDLEVGDWVWAHDFVSDQKVARRIKHLIPGKTDAWVHLYTDKGEIVATPGHDFWVLGSGAKEGK